MDTWIFGKESLSCFHMTIVAPDSDPALLYNIMFNLKPSCT